MNLHFANGSMVEFHGKGEVFEPQVGGYIDIPVVLIQASLCAPSRSNVLTGYNVTEEFEQLEKVEVARC